MNVEEGQRYTLDDVVDDSAFPPEPSTDYLERLDLLDNVVRECMYVSKQYAGIPSPTGKHFYASVLFTAVLTRGVSLLILAPHTPWASKKIEHWDYASMTGVVRTIIELRAAFYYLCVEACSEEEWNVRWNLFNLHDCVSRARLAEARDDKKDFDAYNAQAEELRDRLKGNSFFRALDPKRHKKLLHGQTAYLLPLEVIMDRAGLEIGLFRWLYVMLSSHVHGLPMSFYRMGGDNPDYGRGLPSPIEERYSSLCLSLAATLLVGTRDEMHKLFEGLGHPIAAEEHPGEIDEVPDSFLVGDRHEMQFTPDVSVKFERREEGVICLFSYVPNDEIVLELMEAEDGGRELLAFDALFWTLDVNGKPVTTEALNRILGTPHAFRFDFASRVLKFKIS